MFGSYESTAAAWFMIEGLALRIVRDDVDEDDVRVVAAGDLLRARGADVAGADDRDLSSHVTRAPSLSMIASATSLVPTADGSSRVGFMSYVRLFPSAITAATALSSRAAAPGSSR